MIFGTPLRKFSYWFNANKFATQREDVVPIIVMVVEGVETIRPFYVLKWCKVLLFIRILGVYKLSFRASIGLVRSWFWTEASCQLRVFLV